MSLGGRGCEPEQSMGKSGRRTQADSAPNNYKGTDKNTAISWYSYINHSCVPNARKHFDIKRRMTVVAAGDIAKGEEVLLSYTASLLATPVRQVRLLLSSVNTYGS